MELSSVPLSSSICMDTAHVSSTSMGMFSRQPNQCRSARGCTHQRNRRRCPGQYKALGREEAQPEPYRSPEPRGHCASINLWLVRLRSVAIRPLIILTHLHVVRINCILSCFSAGCTARCCTGLLRHTVYATACRGLQEMSGGEHIAQGHIQTWKNCRTKGEAFAGTGLLSFATPSISSTSTNSLA